MPKMLGDEKHATEPPSSAGCSGSSLPSRLRVLDSPQEQEKTAALLQQCRRSGICDRDEEPGPSHLWARASIVPERSIPARNGQGLAKLAREGGPLSGSGCPGVHIPTVAARVMAWISSSFQQVWTVCSPTQAGYQYNRMGGASRSKPYGDQRAMEQDLGKRASAA